MGESSFASLIGSLRPLIQAGSIDPLASPLMLALSKLHEMPQ